MHIIIVMQNPHNEIMPEPIHNVTGVILAGGKSRRMGKDKARLSLSGRSLFSINLELLRTHFHHVIIAGDRTDLEKPEIPSIPDIFPDSALGGLYTGLKSAGTDWIFVTPCDMPHPDSRILELLFSLHDGADAVVPQTPNGYEPVFAFYHKNCLPVFEDALKSGRKSIYGLFPLLNIHFLTWENMPAGWEKSLMNINTPEDLAKVKEGSQ